MTTFNILGNVFYLETLLLDSNNIKGAVPEKVCSQRSSGNLINISSDCKEGTQHKVQCSCCFNCPDGQNQDQISCPDIHVVAASFGIEAREKEIRSRCIGISGNSVCQHNSPQNLAMRWLVTEDKMNLDVSREAFAQRYTMAVAYFSLGPDGWVQPFWLSPFQHECDIAGISCNLQKRITTINFGKFRVF